MDEIQQQNQNIETLLMKLNEQKSNAETVNNYGTNIDKHIFSHFMETSCLKEMESTESRIRNTLNPQRFTTKEKHSVVEIVKKLKDAIEVIDKELITGCDSHNSLISRGRDTVSSATPENQAVLLSGREQFLCIKTGTRVVRGPRWSYKDQDGGPGGRGTVTKVNENGWVDVRWDHSGRTCGYYCMGYEGMYRLKLAD